MCQQTGEGMKMRAISTTACVLTSTLTLLVLAVCGPESAAGTRKPALAEFEKMTWVEVKNALAAGRTTMLIYTGGVEQRGPQNANGGHNQMAYATVKAIADRLGNALFLPVLPFTPNNADPQLPGTIGITGDMLGEILERLSEQSIANGFRNVVLMGDHGGGQPKVYADVAKKLNDKYSPQGIHVYYCDQVYKGADDAFDRYLAEHGYPASEHGGIPDTAEMMYLDKDHSWVRRNLVATAVGDPVVNGQVQPGPNSPHNGISGDARRSTPELGKKIFDMKVDYAVRQIQGFLAQE